MLKPKPPCYPDCHRRSITCHAECLEYADYVSKLKKYNAAVKAEKNRDAEARDLKVNRVKDWNKRSYR